MTDAVPHPHAGLIRSLASASAIVAVALGLAGCAATQPKTGEKIDIKDPGKTQTFTFAKATPAGQAIGIDDIKLAVRNAMAGSTPRRDGWDAEQRTVDLNADQSAVVVSSRWAMALNHNSVTMRYPLRVTARGDQYHATLECATVIDWNMLNLSLTGIPQFNMAKVAEDSKAMCENAKPYLPRMAVVRGEVDVEYNSASVFANFRRKLASADLKSWDAYRRAYANANELSIEKAERFLLDVGQGQSPVSISVFPYRNGSKVLYAFGHSFRVDADGTTTYNQAAIDAAKARIKAIAND